LTKGAASHKPLGIHGQGDLITGAKKARGGKARGRNVRGDQKNRSGPLLYLVLLSFGLLCGLAVGEGVLRLLGLPAVNLLKMNLAYESERGKFTRYDPLLGWAGREDVADVFNWVDVSHPVRQNRFGFRGPAYPFSRTGKKRLLVLGDSYAWGFGVADDEIFTARLEEKGAGSWEVINMGVSGYGTDQEYLLWRQEGRRWNPDVVLLLVTLWTDLWDNVTPRQYGYEKPFFDLEAGGRLVLKNQPVPRREGAWGERAMKGEVEGVPWWRRALGKSALAAALVNALARSEALRTAMEEKGIIPARQGGFAWEEDLYRDPPPKDLARAWEVTCRLVDLLQADVVSRGGASSSPSPRAPPRSIPPSGPRTSAAVTPRGRGSTPPTPTGAWANTAAAAGSASSISSPPSGSGAARTPISTSPSTSTGPPPVTPWRPRPSPGVSASPTRRKKNGPSLRRAVSPIDLKGP